MHRRTALHLLSLAATAPLAQAADAPQTRPVPSTGEHLPVVGLGSWITFNVGRDPQGRRECGDVLGAFFAAGGRLVDSSPMYGSSQSVIGEGLQRIGRPPALFAADKVWTSSRGAEQVEASRQLWQVPRFDLLQVHNLLAWEQQLPLLLQMKQAGRVRYVGITTSEGRRHSEFERLMRAQPLDFVQLTYNPVDREAEQRLLPLARERGIAVIANRPFQEGALLKPLRRQKLPAWAGEIGCTTWAQVVLKFIVSHPAMTCAIPATSRVDHVRENMAAASGRMPDEALRRRIAAEIGRL
ncbi:MAG TPA: aldo/keto reductase [Ramlibacter sp.]|jgi:diketogulonate reductase-like aldo/keto reductase|uniref:aldo/keto reductase n=1 Tax=Ramlibacter sp. TaxID=1917967 RepID=UPI002D3ACDB9|nr:aldo/keto reductase [Ramlibacter sp.]HZY18001.1 aldo/keto reductase [Ramlibacter sp.]